MSRGFGRAPRYSLESRGPQASARLYSCPRKGRHPSKLWQNLRLFQQEVSYKLGMVKAYLKTCTEHFIKAWRVVVSGQLRNFLSNHQPTFKANKAGCSGHTAKNADCRISPGRSLNSKQQIPRMPRDSFIQSCHIILFQMSSFQPKFTRHAKNQENVGKPRCWT